MRNFIDLVENLIRLGSNPAKEKLAAFMAEYEEATGEHPLDRGARLLANASLDVSAFDGMIHISDVRALEPRKGGGTEAMTFLCALADKHGVKMHLTALAYSDGRMSTEQLHSWYGRFGFHDEEDTFGDDREGWDMIRYPG